MPTPVQPETTQRHPGAHRSGATQRLLAALGGAAIASLVLTACANRPAARSSGQMVTLPMGGTALLAGGVSLRYAGIRNDSRCPAGVQCIHAGDADVLFDVGRSGTSPVRVVLNSAHRRSAPTAHGSLELIDLPPGPSPAATVRLDPDAVDRAR